MTDGFKKVLNIAPLICLFVILLIIQSLWQGFSTDFLKPGILSFLSDSLFVKAGLWATPAIVAFFCLKKEKFALSPTQLFKARFPVFWFVVYICLCVVFLWTVRLLSGKANTFVLFDAMFVVSALSAGVIEELYFRGYLFNRLSSVFKPAFAAAIDALMFTLYHYTGLVFGIGYTELTFFRIFLLLIMGFLLSLMFYRHKNLALNMAFHFVWNVASYLFVLTG